MLEREGKDKTCLENFFVKAREEGGTGLQCWEQQSGLGEDAEDSEETVCEAEEETRAEEADSEEREFFCCVHPASAGLLAKDSPERRTILRQGLQLGIDVKVLCKL